MKLPEPPEGMLPLKPTKRLLYKNDQEEEYVLLAVNNFDRALDLLFQINDEGTQLQLDINDFLKSISK